MAKKAYIKKVPSETPDMESSEAVSDAEDIAGEGDAATKTFKAPKEPTTKKGGKKKGKPSYMQSRMNFFSSKGLKGC